MTMEVMNMSLAKDVENGVEKEEEHEFCLCCDCGPPPKVGWCGLAVESRPDFELPEEGDRPSLMLVAGFAASALLFTLLHYATGLQVLRPPDLAEWFINAAVTTVVIIVTWFPLGMLVWYRGVSVAITRKVTHTILVMLIPFGAVVSSHGEGLMRDIFLALVWLSLGNVMFLCLIFLKAVRKRVFLLALVFAAIERSEDRPYALLWVLMQSTAMTMVQTPMIQWMLAEQKGLLIFVPFFAVALGDGLAEPVGRMCGRHKYEVSALCTDKKFTRSYEGSFCVFIWTFVAVLIALPEMTTVQAILCLVTIPIANTITEAKAPHTSDNHLMFGVTWVLLWLIFDVLRT